MNGIHGEEGRESPCPVVLLLAPKQIRVHALNLQATFICLSAYARLARHAPATLLHVSSIPSHAQALPSRGHCRFLDILDFSKIEAGKIDMEIIDFDLRTLVEDVGALLAEQAHAKRLELGLLVQARVPTAVRGDPGRLRQSS